MPKSIHSGGTRSLKPWRHYEHARRKSTLQEVNSHDGNERAAAVLHGRVTQQPSRNHTRSPAVAPAVAPALPQQNKQRNHNLNPDANSRPRHAQQANSTVGLVPQLQGRKRKAAPHPEQRPPRRSRQQRSHAPQTLKDEAYIRRTIHIPTAQDYPQAPEGIFKAPKLAITNGIQGLATMRSQFVELASDVWRCTLSYESASHNQVVEAEGRSKVSERSTASLKPNRIQKSAEIAAYLHFLAKCHELGILTEIIDRKSALNLTNLQQKKEEKDAIVDIFNYAARFNCIPHIEAKSISRGKRARKSMGLVVDLPEQAIHVEGYGFDLQAAETDAGTKFKRAAEEYHAKQGNESLVIKDSTALTTDNADQFVQFLKIIRPGIRFEVACEQVHAEVGRQRPFRVNIKVNDEPMVESVEMMSKKKAEATAWLITCVAFTKQDPELWPRYLRALELGNGQILRPVAPLDMIVDEDCSLVMRETLLGARKAGLPDEVEDTVPISDILQARRNTDRQVLFPDQIKLRSTLLSRKLDAYKRSPQHAEARRKKDELPMNQYRAKVLDLINNNVYSIIVGATGSGKTTQVPQILLEDAISKGVGGTCNIICTQPRRIAATSVARRVAAERAERLQESVGYHVRFDAKLSQSGGSINYCTTGILLQQLQHTPNDILDNTSYLVIDEVHERDVLIDFLLILLKKSMLKRRALGKHTPQVVLMSATMDTDLFASYFKSDVPGKGVVDCPSLSVPGRTFPVRERYIDEILQDMVEMKTPLSVLNSDPKTGDFLEAEQAFQRDNRSDIIQSGTQEPKGLTLDRAVIDWRRERKVTSDGELVVLNEKENALVPFGLVAATVAHIAKTTREGAILVFLPGLEEIVQVENELKRSDLGVNLMDTSRYQIYMLHSSIAASQQTVFDKVPEGCRKIILSTNIAETSVTIPDVQHVVDTGKLREKQYDQIRRITMLLCTWISKSNSKQRAGRAGRVQDGNYYALFSKERYDSFRAIGLPELLRTDLQETCLDIKAQAFDTPVREFLADAIEPPRPKSVDASVVNLQALDALTDDERITPLGRLLAALPVHPTLGKMIVLGIIFRCLDPMLILGAASAERSLFLNPPEARAQANASKLSFVEGSGSDHIALLNAVRELRHLRDTHGEGVMRDFAIRNFLHQNAFRTIDSTAKQIEEILVQAGLIPFTPPHSRRNSQFGDPSLNENSHKVPLIKALNLAGLHPNLAVTLSGGRLFRTPGEINTMVHPSSTNAPKDNAKGVSKDRAQRVGAPAGTLYTYSSLAKSNDGNSLFLRDTTESTPLQAALFGGKLQRNSERGNIIEIDDWLPFYVSSPDRRTAKTIIEFRKALERLLAIAFNDLGKTAERRRTGEQVTYLADEKVREGFASGLVEVLDRDITVDENVKQRGWGATREVDISKPSYRRGANNLPSGFMQDLLRR